MPCAHTLLSQVNVCDGAPAERSEYSQYDFGPAETWARADASDELGRNMTIVFRISALMLRSVCNSGLLREGREPARVLRMTNANSVNRTICVTPVRTNLDFGSLTAL